MHMYNGIHAYIFHYVYSNACVYIFKEDFCLEIEVIGFL